MYNILVKFSASNEELDQLEVEYITLPGWKTDTTSVRKFEDLPVNARCYIRKIEEIVGVPGKIDKSFCNIFQVVIMGKSNTLISILCRELTTH